MPELKLDGGVARSLVLVDNDQQLTIYFVLTACAPTNIEEQAKQWYKDNPSATPYELVKWMQGKNWGVLLHDETVYLHH